MAWKARLAQERVVAVDTLRTRSCEKKRMPPSTAVKRRLNLS